MSGWLDEQIHRNRMTRDCWARYEEHRARVMELVVGTAVPPGPPADRQLALLGVGNANDVDLARLCDRYSRIFLVDLDGAAVAAGVAGQRPPRPDAFQICGNVDCSGILPWIEAAVAGTRPTASQVDACLHAAAGASLPAPLHTLDAIGSLCLLSQIVEAAHHVFGADHPRRFDLIRSLRQRHLEQLVGALRPGGRGVILIDFVSSATCPQLTSVNQADLPGLAHELLRQRNFFTGLNPFVMWQQLQQPPLASQVHAVELSAPWLWHFPARTYAVCGLQFIRSG